jgi:thiamine-monophosphate kinase
VALFRGLAVTAESYGCPIAGGETTSTPGPLTVTVTVVGRAEPGRVVLRSGARDGDAVYVTGCLGDAMAGLEAFKRGEAGYERLKKAYVRPDAKVAVSRELTARFKLTAMIDLSDGLATDIAHICEESGLGATVEDTLLPMSGQFGDFMGRTGRDPVEFALSGGEEYGLLFTSSDPGLRGVHAIIGEPITRIGIMTRDTGSLTRIAPGGALAPFTRKGYEHFRQ